MATAVVSEEIKQIVYSYAMVLKKKYSFHSIYLYGSYVYGNADEDSDIDVAVVAENFQGDIIDDTVSLMRLRRGIDLRIEPRPFTVIDFTSDNPFADEVIQNGIRIV